MHFHLSFLFNLPFLFPFNFHQSACLWHTPHRKYLSTLVRFHLPILFELAFPLSFQLSFKRIPPMHTSNANNTCPHLCVFVFLFPFNLLFLFPFNFHQNIHLEAWNFQFCSCAFNTASTAFITLFNSNEACVNACVICITACAITDAFNEHKTARALTSLASSLVLWHMLLMNVKLFNSHEAYHNPSVTCLIAWAMAHAFDKCKNT